MGRKAADYAGIRFNMLIGVRNTGEKTNNAYIWEWLCDCGKLHRSLPSHVRSGSTKSCGCYRKEKSIIKSGERYGRLTAIKKTEEKSGNSYLWEFKCDCGNTVRLTSGAVTGTQKSCGCLKKESKPNLKHGHCSLSNADSGGTSRTYRSWLQMKYRCSGADEMGRRHYKSRNIKVCARWENSFERFVEDMGIRPQGTSIDRIDNDRGYSPANCRWATQSQQTRNTRRTIFVVVNGGKMCLKDACAVTGNNYDKVRSRIRNGAPPQESLDK